MDDRTALKALVEAAPTLATMQQLASTWNAALFPERPPEFFALELAGETGELANLEKKAWVGREVAHSALAEEAADVFITLLNYANARGIDLAGEVARKLAIVDQRQRARRATDPG